MPLTQSILDICADFPVRTFAPGEVLLAEGPGTNTLYVLIEGEVVVLRGEVPVAEASEPGAIFGEMAVLLDGPHTASVRAVTEVRAHQIADARALLHDHPKLGVFIARLLAVRLRDATTYLADVKAQYADRSDHLGMVDVVMTALTERQGTRVSAGPSTKNDPRL
ncbi:MAG: cyclic nucleotide-binding domain-containing protein [Hyphomicrobiaceae bacterium]|nr:cyclic nucleotide-binding domain-containing protein [Hyphomicrobiaceae bacterium]